MHTALDEPVPSRGHAIFVICIVAPIITGIIVFLRAYSRFLITKKNFAADWVSYATLAAVAAFSGTLVPATYWGMGRHVWDFSTTQTEHMYFWIMVSSAFYVLSLLGYKMALLLLYLQLFGVYQRYRYIVYGVMFYTCGYLLCNLIIEFAGCQPIQKFYMPKTPGHCTDSTVQNIAFGVGHMTSDLAIAILPLPMIYRLQLRTRREKLGLVLVLGTGLIAWLVACIRFVVATVDLTSSDKTWVAGITFFLSVLEVNTGLICACLPALKPLIVSVRDASQSWSRKRSLGTASWSRKRSLGYLAGRKGSEPLDAEAAKTGFVELRPVASDSANGSDSDRDAHSRATFARKDTDPESRLGAAEALDTARPVANDEGLRPIPPVRGHSSMHWDAYTIRGASAHTPRSPGAASVATEELFAGTGMQPIGPKTVR